MLFKLPFTLALLFFSPLLYAETPVLSSDSDVATAGYFRLSWKSKNDNHAKYQLQESLNDASFNHADTIYQGTDKSAVLSGKSNGEYFYRVRVISQNGAEPWSESTKVVVEHHTLTKAFLFFFGGLLVFLTTAVFIFVNTKKQK